MKLIILSIALGMTATAFAGPEEEARKAKVAADLNFFSSTLKMYKLTSGAYPITEQGLKALVAKPKKSPVPKRWTKFVEVLPKDPWERPYEYKSEDGEFAIWSKGPDEKDDSDDIRIESGKKD